MIFWFTRNIYQFNSDKEENLNQIKVISSDNAEETNIKFLVK